MDDAGLDLCLRERRLDGLGKALEAVHDRDEDVLDLAIAKIIQRRLRIVLEFCFFRNLFIRLVPLRFQRTQSV